MISEAICETGKWFEIIIDYGVEYWYISLLIFILILYLYLKFIPRGSLN